MRQNEQFAKFACFLSLLISLFAWLDQFTTSQSQIPPRPKFSPPLKGTEILLEADQPESKQRRRGIWAMDPKTGKVRFLIPNGSRPFWSPKRNYIAYQKYNEIKVIDKAGRFEVSCSPVFFEKGQLVGWGHNEELLLYITPNFHLGFLRFNPKKTSLTEAGFVDISDYFPKHYIGNPTISFDGKYIVFEAFRYIPGIGKINSKLVLAELYERISSYVIIGGFLEKFSDLDIDLDIKNIRRLTSLPMEFIEINPQWSPDNKKIAFEVVGLNKSNRIAHIINLDGSGLKGFKLYIGHLRDKEEALIKIQEGLVTEMEVYDDHELRVIGWLSSSRIAIAESIFELNRYADRMNELVAGLVAVRVVDIEQTHPFVDFLTTGRNSKFLQISPNKKQLVLGEGFDDFLTSVYLFDIPETQNINQLYLEFPLPEPVPLSKPLAVYWANW